MAKAAVRSEVVVLLLLIYSLMYFQLEVGVLLLSLFCYALLLCPLLKKRKKRLVVLPLWSHRCLVSANVV